MTPLQPARRLDSPSVLWALLALPGIVMTFDYIRGAAFYGEVLHSTGELAAQLLIVTLAISPLRAMLPNARWLRWLARRRRYLGVAVFGYAALHAGLYVARLADLERVLGEALTAAMATGWVAFAIFIALAATSNDVSVRRMGRKWRWLHRSVYVAALLTFAHWVLAAFDPVPGFVHLGVLAAVESLRLPFLRKAPRERESAKS